MIGVDRACDRTCNRGGQGLGQGYTQVKGRLSCGVLYVGLGLRAYRAWLRYDVGREATGTPS